MTAPRARSCCSLASRSVLGAGRGAALPRCCRQPRCVPLLRVKMAVARKEESVSSLRKQYAVSEGVGSPRPGAARVPGRSQLSLACFLAGGRAESRAPGSPPGAAAQAAAGPPVSRAGGLGGERAPGGSPSPPLHPQFSQTGPGATAVSPAGPPSSLQALGGCV